jgi:hypothetical protein
MVWAGTDEFVRKVSPGPMCSHLLMMTIHRISDSRSSRLFFLLSRLAFKTRRIQMTLSVCFCGIKDRQLYCCQKNACS